MSRVLGVPPAVIVLLSLHSPCVLAQDVYGAVAGTARSGMVVGLVGTAFRARADPTDFYRIDAVPAGTYEVEIDDGVRRVTAGTVRIVAGARQTADLTSDTLGRWVLSAGALDWVGRRLASSVSLSGRLLEEWPAIDDPQEALPIIPGVITRGADAGIADVPIISLRGSLDPPSVYVDGAPATFQTLGGQGLAIAPNALAEASVTTGISPPQVRDASAGTIGYVTRAGRSRLEGTLRAQSDGLTGRATRAGSTSFQARVGGPTPIRRLTWLVSGTLQGQQSRYRGRGAEDQPTYIIDGVDTTFGAPYDMVLPRFVQWSGRCGETGNTATSTGEAIQNNYGLECHGVMRPMDWVSASRGHAKIFYSYGRQSSVSLTVLGSATQRRDFPGTNIGDSALYTGQHAWSRLTVINWSQSLGRAGSATFRMVGNVSFGADRLIAGALDAASELATRDPPLGISLGSLQFTGTDSIPFPLTEQIIHNVRNNTGLRVPLLDASPRNAQAARINPFGFSRYWPTYGIDVPLTAVFESRTDARWEVARESRSTRLALGIDAARTTTSYYDAPSILRETYLNTFLVHPKQFGLYAAARVEGKGFSVDAGLRLDYFGSDALFPETPGRVFTNPLYSLANPLAVYDAAAGHSAVSPRLRLGYRPSRGAEFRFGFGRQATMPSYDVLFGGTNTDLSYGSAFGQVFGRDVAYAMSQWWELGFRGEIGHALSVDVVGYSKDRVGTYDAGIMSFFDPLAQRPISLEVPVANQTHGAGLDAWLRWRITRSAMLSAAYAFVRRSESAQPPTTALPGLLGTSPANETNHQISALVTVTVPRASSRGTIRRLTGGVGVWVGARAVSGVPYTRLKDAGTGVLAPGELSLFGERIEPMNASRLPWTRTLDLRLGKEVRVRGVGAAVYLDFRNLLSATNIHALYAETGTVENQSYRDQFIKPEMNTLANLATAVGALGADGTVNLQACGSWGEQIVDCVALTRVENRFGNGDGLYTAGEQQLAGNAFFDSLLGAWRLRGPGRVMRIGAEFRF